MLEKQNKNRKKIIKGVDNVIKEIESKILKNGKINNNDHSHFLTY